MKRMGSSFLSTRLARTAGAAGLALTAAFAAMMMMGKPQTIALECQQAAKIVQRLKPLAVGDMAAFQIAATPLPLPALSFADPQSRQIGLGDFSGRVTLVNLWATWCAPCRKEMPALDQLQNELGGDRFEVVAINIDTRNLDRPKQWLNEAGITRLNYYSDPKASVFQELRAVGKAVGMPTTLLIDAKGCELGVLHGAAEWASADAKALIRAALAQ